MKSDLSKKGWIYFHLKKKCVNPARTIKTTRIEINQMFIYTLLK